MNKIILVVPVLLLTMACSIPSLDDVLSDKRTEYERSKSLPPLDVPPDLRENEPSEAMSIPGEKTTASLKDFQNQARKEETIPSVVPAPQITNTIASSITTSTISDDGSSVVVRGDNNDVWTQLRLFFFKKGYTLDIDDFDLGVLETNWPEQYVMENGLTYRYKYKVFMESGADQGVTFFYIENERQEQLIQNNGNSIWIDRDKSMQADRLLAGEMNQYFNGQQQSIGNTAATQFQSNTPVPRQSRMAEIQDVGDDKILLAIPEEYTMAWRRTEQALQKAGLVINGRDQVRGLFRITYYSTEEEKGGWMSKLNKLKFWKRDEDNGISYQIALTGIDNKTELVLLDEDGDWEESEDAERILSMIQAQYNKL